MKNLKKYTDVLLEIEDLLSRAHDLTTKLKEAAYSASYEVHPRYNIQAQADTVAENLLKLLGDVTEIANAAHEAAYKK